ncbi:MAG: cation:proton antiporter, partial [Phascolarctobacterium sp.]|nr:cation:proton antiporter [Phascolarctobacterium sp.]
MAHLPQIIVDLAMILLVAGVTTILFKKLNQPLVLGYIIAGFITGPHFSFFPTVSDSANIQVWSEIGVIFLLFALGLEFSFYKLKSVGNTAFIATAVEIGGMLGVGYVAGSLLGWSHMDSIFLGGMLAMSSTTIIIKAFEDLKLKGQRFTEMVFGVLIVEDIAGIIMMVMLSTLAAAGISTLELAMGVGRLAFFLTLWFVMGMYLIPTFFKKAKDLMNDETLIVASVGLCLGMVVLATHMGFSAALGAFIMGSLIAEAPNAEHIEHLVKPVKDLFGAVFFVSVGMLVDPSLLLQYWFPILCLVAVTIIGKLIFSTGGVLAAGQNLNISMHCGFSLAQIGEFSFIIASLGMSLGVISDFLYPIIVAVSVVTTFTTPFFIMAANPAYKAVNKILPNKLLQWLDRYTDADDEASDNDWRVLLQEYFTRMFIFLTLLFAIAMGAKYYLLPYLQDSLNLPYSNLIGGALTLLVMSPILRVILTSRTRNAELFSVLWFKKRSNHLPLMILLVIKMVVAAGFLMYVFQSLMQLPYIVSLVAVAAVGYLIYSSDWLLSEYLRIESRFLVNLNEKHMRKHRDAQRQKQGASDTWFDEDLQLARYKLSQGSSFIGKTLLQTNFRSNYGCNILQVTSPNNVADMPGAEHILEADSSILVIGTREQFKMLTAAIEGKKLDLEQVAKPLSLREFMLHDHEEEPELRFLSLAITIDQHSKLLGKSIKDANIRENWSALVIGLERGAYTITNPNVSLTFEKGDLLWILGKQKMMNTLIKEEV